MRTSWLEFQSIIFHPGHGSGSPCKGCSGQSPLRNRGYRRGDRAPLYVKNCDESFFAQISVKISQSYFLRFQAFSKSFEKKMQPCFFHDSKSSMNILSILKKKKLWRIFFCSNFGENFTVVFSKIPSIF